MTDKTNTPLEVTGRTPWDLVTKLLSKISWSFILQILVIALLGIPVLRLYVHFVPEIFPPRRIGSNIEYVIVPANQLWVDTGIVLKPGETIKLSASGQINLAVHRLVEAANEDRVPWYGWVGPEGKELPKAENPPTIYIRRQEAQLLIHPESKPGCLLMYLGSEGQPPPDKRDPRPKDIMAIGRGPKQYRNESKQNQQIYLTVNEKLLANTDKAREAYVGTQAEIDATYGLNSDGTPRFTLEQLEKRYKYVIDNAYWDVWFDDNIGEFLVKVEFLRF
jgi:hypothetical protein